MINLEVNNISNNISKSFRHKNSFFTDKWHNLYYSYKQNVSNITFNPKFDTSRAFNF